ncbi:MAG: hypothetical protein ACRDHZ_11405 [Ktedonobacteraceae bacterium]
MRKAEFGSCGDCHEFPHEFPDDDPERRADVREITGAKLDRSPLEKVAMLSQTVLNSTFCVLQEQETR